MNYKITITFFIAILLYSVESFGQDKEIPKALSLEQAKKTAVENNPNLKIKSIQSDIAKKQEEQAQRERIPDIYGSFDFHRNLIIPTTPVPAKAFNPNAAEGEIMPLQFMTKWTSKAGINAKVDIYNPEVHGKVSEAAQQTTLKQTEEKISANQLRHDIATDYAAILIAQQQLDYAVKDTLSRHKILKMTHEQYDAGRLKISALNEIIVDQNNAVDNYLEAVKILEAAKAQLLADMGYDLSQNIQITLTDSIANLLHTAPSIMDAESDNSLSLQKISQQENLTNLQLKHTKAGYLPTVSLKGFYGSDYYDDNLHPFETEKWYGNSYVGLSITLPITKGLSRIKKVEALHLQQEVDKENYKAQENKLQLALVQAQQDIDYKEKSLSKKKTNLKLNEQNVKTATEQFSNGRLLIGDWIKVNLSYQNTKTAYLQAAYDLLVAKMKWQKLKSE